MLTANEKYELTWRIFRSRFRLGTTLRQSTAVSLHMVITQQLKPLPTSVYKPTCYLCNISSTNQRPIHCYCSLPCLYSSGCVCLFMEAGGFSNCCVISMHHAVDVYSGVCRNCNVVSSLNQLLQIFRVTFALFICREHDYWAPKKYLFSLLFSFLLVILITFAHNMLAPAIHFHCLCSAKANGLLPDQEN